MRSLIYLDQNYASRIAKFRIGQPSHAAFGEVQRALWEVRPQVPPSPFHVLETRGGYLLPTLKQLFGEHSGGAWVRPWQQVVRRQAQRGFAEVADLLSDVGNWETPATLDPLEDLLELDLGGGFLERRLVVRAHAAERFGLAPGRVRDLPFFDLLGRMVAFRSRDEERADQPSDLTDLVMAATIAPYVDVLATDRYVAEMLARVKHLGPVFSGRRPDALRFAAWLRSTAPGDGDRSSGGQGVST